MEKINCCIEYAATGNPTCQVFVEDVLVHEFIANTDAVNFNFSVDKGPFKLKFVHYGKNMKRETNKFIELKKIYFNDIDIKSMIWETKQVAEIPTWQNAKDYTWEANLYFGHNGYVEYNLESPIMDFLLHYHSPDRKVSSNMGSYDMKLLEDMKEYFSKLVEEQEKNDISK